MKHAYRCMMQSSESCIGEQFLRSEEGDQEKETVKTKKPPLWEGANSNKDPTKCHKCVYPGGPKLSFDEIWRYPRGKHIGPFHFLSNPPMEGRGFPARFFAPDLYGRVRIFFSKLRYDGIPVGFFPKKWYFHGFFLLPRGTFHMWFHGFYFLTSTPSIGKSMDFF